MKKTNTLSTILIISLTFLWVCLIHARKEIQNEETIAAEIIRFHVLANSDSTSDQQLKIKVRNGVIDSLTDSLKDVDTLEDARLCIEKSKVDIQKTAESIITQNGESYPVQVVLQDTYFPEKTYGDLTFPAGKYQALRILIGKAKGKNWWCVLFPSLCFVDETTAIVPDKSKEKLQNNLPDESYESLLPSPSPSIEFDTHIGKWFRTKF